MSGRSVTAADLASGVRFFPVRPAADVFGNAYRTLFVYVVWRAIDISQLRPLFAELGF